MDGSAGTGGGGADGAEGGADRAEGGACVFPVAQYAFPDSPTIFCSNGSLAGACPIAGDPTFGQDGNRLGPLNTYVLANGVVSDSMLGLEWVSNFPGPQIYANANDHCNSLDFDGKQDWRLPTRFELMSIVDYGRFDPVVDTTLFAAPTGTYRSFWTRNLHASSGQDHWVVNSQDGAAVSRADLLQAQTRCVRGQIRLSTFTELTGCSIVFDSRTGLGWQKWPSAQTFGWSDAILYCENSQQDGFSDWRLPNVKELQTIIDHTMLNPAVDPNAFPGTPAERFWTSSPFVGDPSHAWAVDFWDGAAANNSASSTPFRVRCVRGG